MTNAEIIIHNIISLDFKKWLLRKGSRKLKKRFSADGNFKYNWSSHQDYLVIKNLGIRVLQTFLWVLFSSHNFAVNVVNRAKISAINAKFRVYECKYEIYAYTAFLIRNNIFLHVRKSCLQRLDNVYQTYQNF